MGLLNWCQDRWLMTMRTKPHYNSILGRKRSSIKSPPKLSSRGDGKCGRRFGIFICIVTMCCSLSYGVLLVLSEVNISSSLTTYLIALIVAGIVSISGGLCLAEYINNQSQETVSIYGCCYQYSSEILAFFIGWTWLISQTAVISAICKVLTSHVNDWTDDIPRKFLEKIFYAYAKDAPSVLFVLTFILFILTGFGETVVWYALFIPIAFVIIIATQIIDCVASNTEIILVDTLNWSEMKGLDEILSASAVCMLFFSGPQSLVRLPINHMKKNTTAVLGPLNVIALITAFAFIMVASLSDKSIFISPTNELLSLTSKILCTISLCSLGIEAFYPLHFIIEDMSSDGLFFRSFSKKWKPFCFPVASSVVHIMSFIVIGMMSIFMPLLDVLNLVVVFPLLVNSIVPVLVLIQRYRDNNSWQYEPMLHSSARNVFQDRSRRKSEEFHYTNVPGFDITNQCEISPTCDEENLSDSTSSDTDIDSVVQQYKEHKQIASMPILECTEISDQNSEPTPSSSFRAKFCIFTLFAISLIVSMMLNFAYLTNSFPVMIIVLFCVLLSTVLQGLLICLPQNHKLDKTKGCCSKLPSMPWAPGMASLISTSLLVHALIKTWKVSLGCFILGIFLYFAYGIRSSTAANSFYNMRTTHITLRPLPNYGNNCIPQIIPSQRKALKSRKHKKLKTGYL